MADKIPFDTFAALALKTGVIKTAEAVADADRLLALTVDIGEDEPRNIVAGIAPYISDPEILIGQQCVVVANLEPRTIRGLESNGMLLAASNTDAFALLQPAADMTPGSEVR